MSKRTHRFRRVTAAAVLGMGMTAGVIGVTAGVAGATSPTTGTISATSSPTITNNNTAQTAGTVKVGLTSTPAGDTYAANDKLVLSPTLPTGVTVTTTTKPTVKFTSKVGTAAASTATVPAATVTVTTSSVTIVKTAAIAATTTTISFTVSGLKYKAATTAKAGKVTVKAEYETTTGTAVIAQNGFTATGSLKTGTNSVKNATIALVAGSTTGNSISASSAPTVPTTGTNQAAGNLTINLRNNTGTPLATTTTYVDLTASATGTVDWNTATLSTSGVSAKFVTGHAPTTTPHVAEVAIELTSALTKTAIATISVTGITYNTSGAQGTIKVTPRWLNAPVVATATVTEGAFTPASVVNAVSSAAVTPTAPSSVTVAKVSEPYIGVGKTGQSAGTETLTLNGSTSATQGWKAGASITLQVKDGTSTSCTISNFTAFDGTPTVTLTSTGSSSLSTTPKVTASLAYVTAITATHKITTCAATGKTDLLKLTFTNAVTIKKTTSKAGKAVFNITGIHYSVGATNAAGVAKLTGTAYKFAATNPTVTTTSATNAYITFANVQATSKTVSRGTYNASITPITVTESKAGTVKKGWVCLALSTATTPHFNTTATPSVKVTGGNATVASTVKYLPATGAKTKVLFDVTAASSTSKPSKFVLSGLAVNAPSGTTKSVTVTATSGNNATCTGGSSLTAVNTVVNTAKVLATGKTTTRVAGATADATAVKLLETTFPTTTNTANTTPTNKDCPGWTDKATGAAVRPVIIATTATYQDALSAQYLASYLHTGVLLTPTGTLPNVTVNALRTEGITQVYVVGGTYAVSTNVFNELKTLSAYNCGGTAKLTTGTKVLSVKVTRIAGYTAADTAAAIAETAPSNHVLKTTLIGAYSTVNATKGNGKFNDTPGAASAQPMTGLAEPTAIIASSAEFQDAMAASTLSYWQKATGGLTKSIPILLTTPTTVPTATAGALTTLGIKQAIVMGGTLAVTNAVVTSLQGMGIEVLRVAGHSYTDTATQLAKLEMSATGTGLAWGSATTTVAVARGNGFTDGLVGAVVAGKNAYPMLLTTSPTAVGKYLTAFLKAAGQKGTGVTTHKISTLEIFGGTLAVTPAVVSQMQKDINTG